MLLEKISIKLWNILQGYVEQCSSDDADVEINKACILFKVNIFISWFLHLNLLFNLF